jgi:rhodanese-related sulfurtransferase
MIHPIRMLMAALAAGLATQACTPAPTEAPPPTAPARPTAAPVGKKAKKPAAASVSEKVTSIGFDGFFALHQEGKALVFDSRPAYHHQLGHIPGAVSLPKDAGPDAIAAVENDIKQALAAGKTIVVYCSGMLCADARTVARRIAAAGYPASVFSGGWDAWTDAGLPVE